MSSESDQISSLMSQIEAILFAADKPLSVEDLEKSLGEEAALLSEITTTLRKISEFYKNRGGGFELVHVKHQGYQFQTAAKHSELMEFVFSKKARPLSRAAQETLAIIAYRQPVTRADIEFIRGVDAGSIIKNLLEKQLIQCTGRKEVAGRPMQFGTTNEFLRVYELESLSELTPLDSFQPSVEIMDNALDKIEEHTNQVTKTTKDEITL